MNSKQQPRPVWKREGWEAAGHGEAGFAQRRKRKKMHPVALDFCVSSHGTAGDGSFAKGACHCIIAKLSQHYLHICFLCVGEITSEGE